MSWLDFEMHSSGDGEACLVSGGQLAWLLNVHSSGDTDCGLSCFRW